LEYGLSNISLINDGIELKLLDLFGPGFANPFPLAVICERTNPNNMKKYIYSVLSLLIILISCQKQTVSKSLSPFYKLSLNGTNIAVYACGTSDYVAQYLNDTAVYVGFGCGGQRAGFFLKGKISDGTYQLNNDNKAWYHSDENKYSTDISHKGIVTIRTIYYRGTGSSIPCIEGNISFEAIEHSTGKTIKVTNGNFLLKKFNY
jgi:hypothetical protein